ncbi:tetraacyldisaccharide 4'-kinase [Candidatus Kinetoplastibacterium crithidii (ex Angomonas deanei ATCC 30255)]|nr:tetraacyldisaccharide 4'-kinase [Candidatus Kinetoplastibacterium crithidii (ex Angomonas deanei ATCC 30255)]
MFYNFIKEKTYSFGILNIYRPNVPIIIVGNIYIGGTGKTPVVIAIVKELKSLGWNPAVISRGYGVRIKKDVVIQDIINNPAKIGDEPALINKETGVTVAAHPNRIKAVKALLKHDPEIDVIICDDGLQHKSIARDFEIVVQDERKHGNGKLLPSGPLRESINKLKEVDFIINNVSKHDFKNNSSNHDDNELYMFLEPIHARNVLNRNITMPLKKFSSKKYFKKIVAIAGIGNHERFLTMLEAYKINIDKYIKLDDHFNFQESTFSNIIADVIIITSKDAIKCLNIKDDRLWEIPVIAKFSDYTFIKKISEYIYDFHHK